MGVPRLYDLCKVKMIQNIHMLDDIGDLPYSLLESVLKHLQNPSQLLELETNCPQLRGETGAIWLRFIQRDIEGWDKKPHEPQNPENWSKVYFKLKKAAEREKAEQEEELKQKLQALQKDRAGNQTQIIEARTGYNPAARRRAPGGGWRGSSSAPRPTGKVALDKLRKGLHDQRTAKPKALHMPAHILAQRRGVVKQAPERMLRMQENEAASRMVVSRNAAARVGKSISAAQTAGTPTSSKPATESHNAATLEKPQRPALPAGQHFNVPRIRTQTANPASGPKRRREEPSVFHAQKRRTPGKP